MKELIEAIAAQHAGSYIATLAMAATLAYLGLFTVLRRIVFTGVALAQLAAAGVATSFFVADSLYFSLAIRQFAATYGSALGGIGMSLAGAFGLASRGRVKRLSPDAFVGILYVTAAALSILLVWKSARGLAELRNILAGEVLLSRPDELFLLWLGLIAVAVVHAKKRREFWLTSFDPEFARSLGQPVRLLEMLFLGSLAVAIALSLQAAGLMLVFSFLLLSPLTGLNLSGRLGHSAWFAAFAGLAAALIGFLAAFAANLPVAPTIVVVSVGIYLLSLLGRWPIGRRFVQALVVVTGLFALAVGGWVFPMPGSGDPTITGGGGHNHGPVATAQGPTRDELLAAALTRLSGSTSAEERQQAAADLQELGDSRATEALVRALLDSDPNVRRAVETALRSLAEQYQPPRRIQSLRESTDPELRMAAAVAQVVMGNKDGIDGLIACLSDPEIPAYSLDETVLPQLRRFAFPFDPFASDPEKAQAIAAITSWWSTRRATFTFPDLP